jgi:hypothetical protein
MGVVGAGVDFFVVSRAQSKMKFLDRAITHIYMIIDWIIVQELFGRAALRF